MRCFAYLHGFASGPHSRKGVALASAFQREGATLHLPDLCRPTFGTQTLTSALAAIDALVASAPDDATWCLIGSSLGGWLAARWAELHPERVDRLVLLCPGFDMVGRWPALLGADAIARWRTTGTLPFKDASGAWVPLHWDFVADAQIHPPIPVVPCPTLLLHGTRDAVVPLAFSQNYAARYADRVRLQVLDDAHDLGQSLPDIEAATLAFLTPDAP